MSVEQDGAPAAPASYGERMALKAEECGDHADAAQWRRVQAAVDEAPPLTAAQKSRLRILLAPAISQARSA